MKRYFSSLSWVKSSVLLSSLCCYSQFCSAAQLTVTSTADSGVTGTLRHAITNAASGDTIVFSLGSPNTITLLSPLPLLTQSLSIGSITGGSATINGNGNFVFFAQNGTINLNNMEILDAVSTGGPGGSNGGLNGGGGGGGGLGAGAGLFVNSGAIVTLTDVAFHSNLARGGTGSTAFSTPSEFIAGGGGGGGGGGFYGASAAGGMGGGGTSTASNGNAGGGGGGGGAGQIPGAPGLSGVLSPVMGATGATGGKGGLGGGSAGGIGGTGGLFIGGDPLSPAPSLARWSGSTGLMPISSFNGGGGGGGIGSPPNGIVDLVHSGMGAEGTDFGGGGGGGGAPGQTGTGANGGNGGFAGGGGGGGDSSSSGPAAGEGGQGGFGGGGGGGGGLSSFSLYAGGLGGVGLGNGGGGGGAALGGAIFVRQGGTCIIKYTNSSIPFLSPTAISGNSAAGGTSGGGGADSGQAKGQDIFLNSGGALTFAVDVPLTISTAIDSDPLSIGQPIFVQGSNVLTLLGENTFNGGVTINQGGHLAIQTAANLGIATAGTYLTLDSGTVELIGATGFSWPNTVLIGQDGGTISVTGAAGATFSGSITGSASPSLGSVAIAGRGTTIFTGQNLYGGTTTINPGSTLEIGATAALPLNSPVVDNGLLIFNLPTPSSQITAQGPISGTGALTVQEGTVILGGANTYGGTTTIDPGSTLVIAATAAFSPNSPVVDNGLLIFDLPTPSSQVTVQSSITGSGALSVEEGIVALGGSSTYGGTTTIDPNGTLIIATSGAVTGGNILNNGSLLFQNTSGTALPGPISGLGTVTMSGTGGRVVLTAADSYSGGTNFNSGIVEINSASALGTSGLSFNGGSLQLLDPFTGPITVASTLQSGGGTIQVDSGVIALYSGSIQGPGAFAVSGSGTLILSGVNTYAGTTNLGPSATLELTSLLSLPSTSSVTDNGNLVFNLTATAAPIPNPINGLGVVTLTGPSQFSLTNSPNLYSGATRLFTGTLAVNDFSSIGSSVATESPLVFIGGSTLEVSTTNGSALNKFFILDSASGGNIQVDSGFTFSLFGPIISPPGTTPPLNIFGPGTLVFSGSDTSLGTTTVKSGGRLSLNNVSFSGPLTVDSEAILDGSGSMGSLINNGSVLLDSPTPYNLMTINGDYTQSAAALLEIQIAPDGSNGRLAVSESVNLDGTLKIIAAPGSYPFATTYTLITAGNTIAPTSSFSNVILPPTPNLFLIYNRDPSVVLTVVSGSPVEGAHVHGHNPQQVLNNLQEIVNHPSLDLVHVIQAMEGFNSDQLTAALNQLHPAQFGAFDLLNANTTSMLTSIFARHTGETCCIHLNQNCGCTNASIWVQPFGYLYDQDRIGEQLGFNATMKGLSAGLNFCSISGLLVGLGGSYTSSHLDWHHHRGHGNMDKASMAIYGDYVKDRFSVEASVVGSLDVFTASRYIHFGSIDRHARHQKRGYDLTGHFGGGGDIQLGSLFLRPFINFDYLYLYQKGFTESGAHSLDLSVKGRRSNMLRSELGLNLTRSFYMGEKGCFAPTIWVSGINECYLIKRHYVANFIDQTPNFEVRTFSHPIYLFSPGIDLSFMFNCGLNAAVRYSAELNRAITTQKMDLRLESFF